MSRSPPSSASSPQRHSNGVCDQLASLWLFPGRQAGRHIGPVVLAERLRDLGIEPRAMRNAARAQLAAEIPPALSGEVIGVAATPATGWAALTAGNWPRTPATSRRRAEQAIERTWATDADHLARPRRPHRRCRRRPRPTRPLQVLDAEQLHGPWLLMLLRSPW
jgi:hypothetical protein